MLDILAQNRAQVVFAEDEHVIEAFASHAPEEALARCVSGACTAGDRSSQYKPNEPFLLTAIV